MEDLPLGRIDALVSEFAVKDPPLGRTLIIYIVFSDKSVSCSFLFSRRTAYIVRDNARTFTTVGLSYNYLLLFSKIFYVFDVVYVKSNSIHAHFLV